MCRRRQRSMPTALVSAMVVLGGNGAALADESGVSFWLLGTYATQDDHGRHESGGHAPLATTAHRWLLALISR